MLSSENENHDSNNDDNIVIHGESTNNVVFTVTKTSSILAKSSSITYSPSGSVLSTSSTSNLDKVLVYNKNGTSNFFFLLSIISVITALRSKTVIIINNYVRKQIKKLVIL